MAACRCGGDHHGSQHDYLERLERKLGIRPLKEGTAVATPERPVGPTCQHNQAGEFDGPACTNQASLLIAWREYDGTPQQEYRCDDFAHISLLTDTVEANPNSGMQVYRLVLVAEAA